MYEILLALHLLFAIFAIGPLVHAATTAARGVRTGDGSATAASARTLRIYAGASLIVVAIGLGLMSAKDPDAPGKHVGAFGQLWIWLSVILWAAAMAAVLGWLAPTLDQATERIKREDSVVSLTGRIAAAGGVVALIFAGIVFLMVYQPGH
ncbi:MAG TPA: hypothetical protein VFH38_02885 [Jatrophihabitans sp.]|nr:hypothetical protein [Jatrophihabitans sp.]